MTKSIKIDEALENYISSNSYELHPVQKEIINYNKSLGDIKKMQISITQAYFMQLLIKINNVKQILEIGTFTGYSSLSMALALGDGFITCLDKNKKTSELANNFFKKANVDKKINLIVGEAIQSLNNLINENKKFDLIFIDADKENYINKNDRMTNIIRDFNTYIKNDDRIEKTILPIGDGLTICRKI